MGLANKISIIRILLVPFFIGCLLYYNSEHDYLRFIALGVFTLAALTDTVDGNIARLKKEKTKIGTFLDPIADKFLLVAAFISLSTVKHLPVAVRMPIWVPLIIISRDLILIIGAILIHVITGNLQIHPTKIGKLTTFLQMVTIISVLLQQRFSYFIWTAAVLFTVISGIDYIIKGSKLLNTE